MKTLIVMGRARHTTDTTMSAQVSEGNSQDRPYREGIGSLDALKLAHNIACFSA